MVESTAILCRSLEVTLVQTVWLCSEISWPSNPELGYHSIDGPRAQTTHRIKGSSSKDNHFPAQHNGEPSSSRVCLSALADLRFILSIALRWLQSASC